MKNAQKHHIIFPCTLLIWLATLPVAAGQAQVELSRAFPSSDSSSQLFPPHKKAQVILNAACRKVEAQFRVTRRLQLVLVLELGAKGVEFPDQVLSDENNPARTSVRLGQWDEGKFALAAVVACRNALFEVKDLIAMAAQAQQEATETIVDVKTLLPAKSERNK
ncbi:MAG: hypothetical protein AB7O65_08175 [Candidatus Korobacteraceae bacterium]